MAAYWMARYGVRARIIDKRPFKVSTGHADGLRMRTLELFDSMGIQHRLDHEAQPAVDVNFWVSWHSIHRKMQRENMAYSIFEPQVPGERGNLIRKGPISPSQALQSPFHHMLLSQARIEDFILDSIREHSDIEVERGIITESFEFDEAKSDNPNEHPIAVKIRRAHENSETNDQLPSKNVKKAVQNGDIQSDLEPTNNGDQARENGLDSGTSETIRAKYIIGCDGAHSWTRQQLDIPFEGESTEHVW